MLARARRHLTFANVCAAIALFISLGTGAAYAANTVGSGDIIDGAVQTQDLADDAVTQVKVAAGSIGSAQILPGAIGSSAISNNAVAGAKVADGSLTTADLRGADANLTISVKAGAVAPGKCSDFAIGVPGAAAGEIAVISVQGKLPSGAVVTGESAPAANTVTMRVCNLKQKGKFKAIKAVPARVVTFG